MDIKRQVFDQMIERYSTMFAFEKVNIEKAAEYMKDCIAQQGVVQVCGVGHAEEFANELNYRAGGIAPVHALRVDDVFVRGSIDEEQKNTFFMEVEKYTKFTELYDLNINDMYILVSLTGCEPLLMELAKQAKEKKQKVITICNRENFVLQKGCESTLLDDSDLVLDICASKNDALVEVDGTSIGQSWTTIANVMAQMITAEVYRLYQCAGIPCPILLSANLKDADIHNNALTDIYGKRVR